MVSSRRPFDRPYRRRSDPGDSSASGCATAGSLAMI